MMRSSTDLLKHLSVTPGDRWIWPIEVFAFQVGDCLGRKL
jgi:hypothetical protein